VEICRPICPELRGISRVHSVPDLYAALGEALNRAAGCLCDCPGGSEIFSPGLGRLQIEAFEDLGKIDEVISLAIHWQFPERTGAEAISETARGAVAGDERSKKIVERNRSGICGVCIERFDEPVADVLPKKHRAGHEDIRRIFCS